MTTTVSDERRLALGPQRAQPLGLARWQARALDAGLLLCWCAFLALSAVSSLGDSALNPGFRHRAFLQVLSPQGWAFFTRDPREAWQRVYTIDGGGGLNPANSADYRGAPWNGASRNIRNRGVVIGDVLSRVPKSAWQECDGELLACTRRSSEQPVALTLQAQDNTGLCGPIVIHETRPVPWAWRASYRKLHAPSRFARVDVSCASDQGDAQ